MGPKKGVSKDEKRQRMLAIFHDSRDVFLLNPKAGAKDIQKAGSARGVIANAVPDILKELVGDDLVHEGKVGISTFYWSFPGEIGTKKRTELKKFEASAAQQLEQIASLKQKQEQMLRLTWQFRGPTRRDLHWLAIE